MRDFLTEMILVKWHRSHAKQVKCLNVREIEPSAGPTKQIIEYPANPVFTVQSCLKHAFYACMPQDGYGYTRVCTRIYIHTATIPIYKVRETPNIADANGIPNAG